MFCTNCGKAVEETWTRCPYCGKMLQKNVLPQKTESIRQNYSAGNLQQRGQLERRQNASSGSLKKPIIVTIVIAVLVAAAIIAAIVASAVIEQKHTNQETLEFAQNWVYDGYEGITLKEVLEYTWNNGIWDSFVTEEDEQYVEYASDKTKHTCIQFAVDLAKKSIEPRYLERDGIPVAYIGDVEAALQEMYSQYVINEKSFYDIGMTGSDSEMNGTDDTGLSQTDAGIVDIPDVYDVLETYREYMEAELGFGDFAGYDFIYLDGDDIPELVVFGNSEASGNLILNYYNGIVYATQLSRLHFSYIEKENLLCNSDGNMGYYYDVVYSIVNGTVQVVAEGNYNDKDGIYQEDNNGEPLYDYYWNGNKVDADTYQSSFEAAYPSASAVDMSSRYCFGMDDDIYIAFDSPAAKPADVFYILPGSDSRYLDLSDLSGLTKEECRIARNEIYARHGRLFLDEELQAYFDSCDWYIGWIEADDFDDSLLNEYELANRDLIVEYEKVMGY